MFMKLWTAVVMTVDDITEFTMTSDQSLNHTNEDFIESFLAHIVKVRMDSDICGELQQSSK